MDKNFEKLKFPYVLIIDASAGSGKTEKLAKQFVQFILSHDIPHNDLSNMLAITFTNNAAKEMKERILTLLKRIILGLELTPNDVKIKAEQIINKIIENYTDFNVQTIDSFMNRILYCSSYELGLPPEVDITESYDYFLEFAIPLMVKGLIKEVSEEEINKFLNLLTELSTSFPWRPVNKIKEKFNEFLEEESKVLEEIIFEDRWNEVHEKWCDIKEIYKKFLNKGLGEKIKKPVKESIENDNYMKFAKVEWNDNFWFDKRKYKVDTNNKHILNLCKDLQSVTEEFVESLSVSYYHLYQLFYYKFKDSLKEVKKKLEKIHIDDINKYLAEYINKENVPEIYYYLGDTKYHFLIDEFQDTDKVQWENIKHLIHEALSKDGSLFVVGDIKQAIYMFRKADYKIMKKLMDEIEGKEECEYIPRSVIANSKILKLKENFRSGSIILDYVDDIFKNKLKLRSDILQEDKTALTSYKQSPVEDKKGKGYVKVIKVQKDDENKDKEVLINLINDLEKRYNLKDIAILANENEEVETIVEWLTEKGFPVASYSSLDIRKRKIIIEIIELLKFLNSPIDNLAFTNFILGDIFDKSVKHLNKERIYKFLFKNVASKNYLYIDFREEFKEVWNLFFDELFRKVNYIPFYEFVLLIFKKFNIFNNFEKEAGFLIKLLDAAHNIILQGINSIKDFIEIIEKDKEKEIFKIILPDYIDAIKVMTFHKAKGLGFKVVINMIYDKKKGKEEALYLQKEEDGLKVYYIPKPFTEKSNNLERIYNEKKLDEVIQNLNLLYVINTRAKEELYNIIIIKKEKTNHELDLFEECEKGKKIEKEITPQYYTHPLKVLIPQEIKTEFPDEERQAFFGIERIIDTRIGEFIHKILSYIDFVENINISDIIKNLSIIEKEKINTEEITQKIIEFLNTPEVREWFERKEHREVQKEVEYIDEYSKVHRIDRILIDKEEIKIIDFKTGDINTEYNNQIRNYIDILSKVYHNKNITGYIGYIDLKKVEKVI